MKKSWLILLVTLIALAIAGGSAQTPVVVIHNPVPGEREAPTLTETERNLMNRLALPKVRKKLTSDNCEESFEPAGVIHGSFSKAGAEQTLIFYQFCLTGNGLANVGFALIENGKIIGNYIAQAGLASDARALPDVNRNGLDEIALYYMGGMHQGASGTGVDILELTAAGIKGIGWFQAASYSEDSDNISYRVTAKPGKTPIYYREKYVSTSDGKWRKVGKPAPLKLTRVVGTYALVR